ncbi:prolyl oligopeptidase family serine peptidase [Curtobacterium sp. Leaf261]|uniref:prolyl oligopeptidase family serine peptidase n=1 Tax=Curtobacterium sp. Leaf261 TaxID=1736311 RepID=UPI0006F49037|nr:prolyl oligopeptidase family serine peptidase [Curtobacterium sp. Leaf261]KQO65162.1 hypothetical protein ASF23_03345 [Curtobacterium sp. Leaf261]
MSDSTFSSLDRFLHTPRVTGLVLSPDGSRLVATVSTPDRAMSKYVDALWEIDPAGVRAPVRITFSTEGESQPAFAADGSLLFVSGRPDPQHPDDPTEKALWRLPLVGEACVIASSPGGLSAPVATRNGHAGTEAATDEDTDTAVHRPTVLVSGSRLVGSADADEDQERRAARKDHGISAILHDGMPIRYWDHELDDTSARLFLVGPDGAVRDLAPDAGQSLRNTDADLAADGTFVLAASIERVPAGRSHTVIVRIETAGDTVDGAATRTVIADEPGDDFSHPRIAPDGSRYVVARRTRGTYDTPHTEGLEIRSLVAAGDVPPDPIAVDLRDVDATDVVWSADGAVLFVSGDLDGAGAVLTIDPWTGRILRRLASDAAYSNLQPTPDGHSLFALRSSIDRPATPVRLELELEDQDPEFLAAPGDVAELPGTLRRVATEVDGVMVPGWLCLPHGAEGTDGRPGAGHDTGPVPLMVWIHGGPFSSWNAWSWRWNPWLAVERGYAVLLPDPALSTGYGYQAIARAWPHRAGIVWNEVEALLDAVLADTSFGLDGERTALLGASFGGYMTNWIAGHTDRFDCIVTHAGLWSLDQQHDTTDAAENKNGLFDTESEHPDWYAQNSPDRTAGDISTPMLLVHGNRDYRVPISEALRAWWDLVSGFDGPPEDMPHRFLQFTSENHWVLSPSNARVWNDTVLAFVDQHVRGGEPLSSRID